VVVLDYDRDGDEDLIITNGFGSPIVYRSDASESGNEWLRIKLVGTRSNRDGIGAVVKLNQFVTLPPVLCLLLAVTVTGCRSQFDAQPTPDKPARALPTYQLPADPATPVISFDLNLQEKRRASPTPFMVIRADGAVEIGDPWGEYKPLKTTMSRAELQALLHAIITEHQFATITERGLWSSPKGKTPSATLAAAILREIQSGATSA